MSAYILIMILVGSNGMPVNFGPIEFANQESCLAGSVALRQSVTTQMLGAGSTAHIVFMSCVAKEGKMK